MGVLLYCYCSSPVLGKCVSLCLMDGTFSVIPSLLSQQKVVLSGLWPCPGCRGYLYPVGDEVQHPSHRSLTPFSRREVGEKRRMWPSAVSAAVAILHSEAWTTKEVFFLLWLWPLSLLCVPREFHKEEPEYRYEFHLSMQLMSSVLAY